jgi:hypothetical protein
LPFFTLQKHQHQDRLFTGPLLNFMPRSKKNEKSNSLQQTAGHLPDKPNRFRDSAQPRFLIPATAESADIGLHCASLSPLYYKRLFEFTQGRLLVRSDCPDKFRLFGFIVRFSEPYY